ncbi:MAG: NADPH-dependent FMN reductase, partial [Alphaproteobacteria bacterium]
MAYKIAVLVGSLREASINRKIAKAICALTGDGLDCRMVEIGDLPLYNQEHEDDPPAEYRRFREEVGQADGVLFVSPEYNRGVTGAMKNAIDVGSRPSGKSVWNGKPAAIVTASPGAIGGFGASQQIRQSAATL